MSGNRAKIGQRSIPIVLGALMMFPLLMGARGCETVQVGTCETENCEEVSCQYAGKTYDVGDTFSASDGCNTCSCDESGQVACTLIGCLQNCGGIAGLACNEGEYCSFAPDAACGAADQLGSCMPIPEACDLIYSPVCGCDGKTYGNDCEAASAGVSVASQGECGGGGGTVCGTRGAAQCASDEFCSFDARADCGRADAPGTCEPRPEVCLDLYEPVCGCDGKTYGNACEAGGAGVSVDYRGECGAQGTCEYAGTTYQAGESFLDSEGCNTCTCFEDGQIACTEKDCPVTTCGGLLGVQCADDEFCSYPTTANCGRADAAGTCEPRPEACITLYDPVCGCDGQTYGNACSAASSGVSVDYSGECTTGGDTCSYDGTTYNAGDSFPSADGCNTCSCMRGGAVACTKRACVTCGGLLGAQCPTGQYCNYSEDAMCGAADQTGVCSEIPEVCIAGGMMVCACNGQTYLNECEAARDGSSVVHSGACR